MALEKHILVDGQVRTIWGDGSVVEASIHRETHDMARHFNSCLEEMQALLDNALLTVARLDSELENVKASNRVLATARDSNATKILGQRTLIFEYEEQVLLADERIRHLEARLQHETEPTVKKRAPIPRHGTPWHSGTNERVAVMVRKSVDQIERMYLEETNEHELTTDSLGVLP